VVDGMFDVELFFGVYKAFYACHNLHGLSFLRPLDLELNFELYM
jgi:hypothetical protein